MEKTEITLFEIQPAQCREPLPKKEIDWQAQGVFDKKLIEKYERVLFFDPAPVYQLAAKRIDPYKRHQGLIREWIFPNKDATCACGCDVKPKEYKEGKFRRWSTSNCSGFTFCVQSIINNYFKMPHDYIDMYYGHKCSDCESTRDLQLDHIVGVKQGGGGCWLSNYRWLCHDCHVAKTNATFGRKSKTSSRKGQFKMDI